MKTVYHTYPEDWNPPDELLVSDDLLEQVSVVTKASLDITRQALGNGPHTQGAKDVMKAWPDKLRENNLQIITEERYRAERANTNILAEIDDLAGPEPNDPLSLEVWKERRTQLLRQVTARQVALDMTRNDGSPIIHPPITLGEAAKGTTTDEDFLVGDGILTRGGKLLIHARSGMGKTTFLDYLCGSLAGGTPFLDVHAVDRPHRVLFVQAELTDSEINDHAAGMLPHFEHSPAVDNLLFQRNSQLGLPGGEPELRQLIRDNKASILCLDPFSSFFRGDNSNVPEQVGLVFTMLDRMLEDPDLGIEGVIVAHHTNHSDTNPSGTWKFEGWPSTIIKLEALPNDLYRRRIKFEKIRAPRSNLGHSIKTIQLGDHGYLYAGDDTTQLAPAGAFLAKVALRELDGTARRVELIDAIMGKASCGERQAANYLADAIQANMIRKLETTGREAYFELAPDVDDPAGTDHLAGSISDPMFSIIHDN